MGDLAVVAGLALFLNVIPGTILLVYFVKISRRLATLLDSLKRETDWRIRVRYELHGPMPLPDGIER